LLSLSIKKNRPVLAVQITLYCRRDFHQILLCLSRTAERWQPVRRFFANQNAHPGERVRVCFTIQQQRVFLRLEPDHPLSQGV
jgi:hypothetical protein